jgi:tetratricopeptide (TPR) repeat protein
MRLRTLGGVALDEAEFSRPKPLLLLSYLALEGRQDRRHVAELFWPEAADRMKSLTVALARLRKGVPGAVEADEKQVWANIDLDAVRFLRLLEQGDTPAALALYEGPFLQGLHLRWNAELEEWVYQTREFLAAHARKALLELAAVWTRIMPVSEIAAELESNLDLLATPARNVPERHRSIRAAFEQSWQRLTPKEQEVLRKLAVFRGGFGREAASKVAGATIPILASLSDKSLLRVDATGRYDRHPLVHQYYLEKSEEHPSERATTEERHGAYYVGFLERWYGALQGENQRHALDVVGEELENLRAAVRWAASKRKLDEVQRISWPLAMAFYMSGRSQDGLALFTQTLADWEGSEPGRHPAYGHALLAQAWLAYSSGRFEEAAEFARASIERLDPHDDHRVVNRALNTLGGALWRMGDYPQAKRYFNEGLELAKKRGDPVSIKTYLSNLAVVEKDAGSYAQAKACIEEAIALLGGTRDLQFVQLLNTLVGLELSLGSIEQAKKVCLEGLQLAKELNFQRMIPHFVFYLGRIAHDERDYPRARSSYQESLRLLRASKDHSLEPYVLAALGSTAIALNALPEAKTHLMEALECARLLDSAPATLNAFHGLAELWARQGNVDAALRLWSLVLTHAATTHDLKEQARQALADIFDKVAPDALEEVLERGKTLALDEVVVEILQEAEARPWRRR